MAGLFGSDFDTTKPADSDPVKYGASWIVDLKRRLKAFVSVMFNPDTGTFKDSVIRQEALIPNGVVADTYTQVWVNNKGLVTKGANPVVQQTAKYYRAIFPVGGHYVIESAGSVYFHDGSYIGGDTHPGGYQGTLSVSGTPPPHMETGFNNGANYDAFSFTTPLGVNRIKATIIGAGGGATNAYGGGGGEAAEAIFPVDGLGEPLQILVGRGGGFDAIPANTSDGCFSQVRKGSTVFVNAAGGARTPGGAGGPSATGHDSSDLLVVRSKGKAGSNTGGGASGSTLLDYGTGGNLGANGSHGFVILEWVQ
jgi:hypothetical protein